MVYRARFAVYLPNLNELDDNKLFDEDTIKSISAAEIPSMMASQNESQPEVLVTIGNGYLRQKKFDVANKHLKAAFKKLESVDEDARELHQLKFSYQQTN